MITIEIDKDRNFSTYLDVVGGYENLKWYIETWCDGEMVRTSTERVENYSLKELLTTHCYEVDVYRLDLDTDYTDIMKLIENADSIRQQFIDSEKLRSLSLHAPEAYNYMRRMIRTRNDNIGIKEDYDRDSYNPNAERARL